MPSRFNVQSSRFKVQSSSCELLFHVIPRLPIHFFAPLAVPCVRCSVIYPTMGAALLFRFDLCLLATRLSNFSSCFSISFSLRSIPAIILAYCIASITAMFERARQWVLSLADHASCGVALGRPTRHSTARHTQVRARVASQ